MRLINWETRLNKYIEKMSDYPFIWGESDCCHFANNAIKEITGNKFNIPILNSFKSTAKYLKENNGIENVIDNYLKRKDVLYANRGDIVSGIVDNKRIGIGVCMGDYIVFKTKEGITKKPINDIITAWGID